MRYRPVRVRGLCSALKGKRVGFGCLGGTTLSNPLT